jgi:hypothetical protein
MYTTSKLKSKHTLYDLHTEKVIKNHFNGIFKSGTSCIPLETDQWEHFSNQCPTPHHLMFMCERLPYPFVHVFEVQFTWHESLPRICNRVAQQQHVLKCLLNTGAWLIRMVRIENYHGGAIEYTSYGLTVICWKILWRISWTKVLGQNPIASP